MGAATVEEKIARANRTQIAEAAQLDRSYVSQVLSRKREPGIDVVIRLAGSLGVSEGEFCRWWKLAGDRAN